VLDHPAAAALTEYVGKHLLQPHPELGREGPVCPFVRQTTHRRALWAAVVPGGDGLSVAGMAALVDDAVAVYRTLRDEDGEDGRALTVVTLFPELTRYDRIDRVHLSRKTGVVEQGLMLGQFYPGCEVSGLWNKDFRPLDAPLPMLVIRKMMNTDFPFLVERTEWLYSYLTHVAPDLPRRLRWSIAERMRSGEPGTAITDLRVHSPGEHAR
jgi:hypothetical protein